jgi:hypothetical protein
VGKFDNLGAPEKTKIRVGRPEIDPVAAQKAREAAMAADQRMQGSQPDGGSSPSPPPEKITTDTVTPTSPAVTNLDSRRYVVMAKVDGELGKRIKRMRPDHGIAEAVIVNDALSMYFANRSDDEIARSLQNRGLAKLRRSTAQAGR